MKVVDVCLSPTFCERGLLVPDVKEKIKVVREYKLTFKFSRSKLVLLHGASPLLYDFVLNKIVNILHAL